MPADETEIWRTKDGRDWRIGRDTEVAWIKANTRSGLGITCAIPPLFSAYATLALPGTGEQDRASWFEDRDRHTAGVLAVAAQHTQAQPWWLGYLETGVAAETIFYDVPKATLYSSGWNYVLIEAGPEQAGSWRTSDPRWNWKGALPDLMFPADRSWLLSTLWDDDWTCIGGPGELVDAFLSHPDLRHRARRVDPSDADVTPPGHTSI